MNVFREKYRPTRMCLGCKERQPAEELVRLQRKGEKVIVVEHRDMRQPGRSVYLCPKLGCMDKVLKRGEVVFKRTKYDKIIVRLEPKQSARLRYAFAHAARRLRARLGVGPQD